MLASLTIIRYKTWQIPFAFFAMALFRLPLWLKKDISFYKLMGSGRSGSFDKTPDLRQWAIMLVSAGQTGTPSAGRFIDAWIRFFQCETCTFTLSPVSSHGTWDQKQVFGQELSNRLPIGRMAVLTRASIRLDSVKAFWANVPAVAERMKYADGLLFSVGIGEVPWIKQATFSIWKDASAMKAFAYGQAAHKDVITKTRRDDWYAEDMFARFEIISVTGTYKGAIPLS